jgi:hypothetical protein
VLRLADPVQASSRIWDPVPSVMSKRNIALRNNLQ